MFKKILVVDDSVAIQKVVKLTLARFDLKLEIAGTPIEASLILESSKPDLVIADAMLGGPRSLTLLSKIRSESQGSPILLLIGTHEAIDSAAYTDAGFTQTLKKPFEPKDLVLKVEELLGLSLIPKIKVSPAPKEPPKPNIVEEPMPLVQPVIPPPPADPGFPKDFESISKSLDPVLRAELQAWVHQIVSEHCAEHVPRLARELILGEIRRLMDEKTQLMQS